MKDVRKDLQKYHNKEHYLTSTADLPLLHHELVEMNKLLVSAHIIVGRYYAEYLRTTDHSALIGLLLDIGGEGDHCY